VQPWPLYVIRTSCGNCILGLATGLAGFVRPTLVAYGIAGIIIAFVYTAKLRWPIGKRLSGLILFCVAGGLLSLTNLYRFGSPFEFGHRLNLNGIDVMRFVTRFQDPFRSSSALSAAIELISSLFLAGNNFNGYSYYQPAFFPGPSPNHQMARILFHDIRFHIFAHGVGGWIFSSAALEATISRINCSLFNGNSNCSRLEFNKLGSSLRLLPLFPVIVLALFDGFRAGHSCIHLAFPALIE